MSAETPLPKPEGEERRLPSLATTVPDAVPLQAVQPPGVDQLSLLREELGRLKSKYGLGQYTEVKADLHKFIATLESRMSGCSERLDELQGNLLLAEAHALLGRAYERLAQELPAAQTWSKSVDLFNRWLPLAFERGADAVGVPDYGIALYKVGRKENAFDILSRFPQGESGRYLGICLMERGQFEDAERLFRNLLKDRPDDPFTHKALGKSLEAQKGKEDEAVEEFYNASYYMARLDILDEALATLERALSLRPESTRVLTLKGQVLHLLNRLPEALEALEHSLRLAPDDPLTQLSLGQVLRAAGENERAVEMLGGAAEALSQDADYGTPLGLAYVELGAAQYDRGRYDLALDAFDRAGELMPNNGTTLYLRGVALERLDRREEAIEALKQAIAADPLHREAYRELVSLLGELERDAEANDLLVMAEERVPDLAPFLDMLRSTTLLRSGNYEAALRAADEALAGDPENPLSLALKGRVLHRMRRDEEAVPALQDALARAPGIDWACAELAEALICLGRPEDAWRAVKSGLQISPDNAAVLEMKGRLLRAAYKPDEAAEALRRALEIDGTRDGAYAELAYIAKEYDSAEEAAERALKLTPDDAWWLGLKGAALRGRGCGEAALATLRRSIELNPRLPWVHIELGKALFVGGQPAQALEAFDHALSLEPDHPGALASKGEVLRTMGLAEEALQVLDRALTLRPKDAWTLGTKGQTLADLQRYEQAVATLQRAIEYEPDIAWIHAILGATCYLEGKYPEALASLGRAMDLEFNPHLAIFTAQVRCDIGDYAIAVALLDSVLEKDEKNLDALDLKGWALQNLCPERAVELLRTYEAAVECAPGNASLHVGYADALYLNDRHEKARDEYLKALSQVRSSDARDHATLSTMGWCQFRIGDYDQAVQSFIAALAFAPDAIYDQFNLALAMTCTKRYDLAEREYRKGLNLAQSKSQLRQRGLVYVALDDLRVALKALPELGKSEEVLKIKGLLEDAYNELDETYKSLLPPRRGGSKHSV